MNKILEQFYNPDNDTYTIPAKYLTKNILKGIESSVCDQAMKSEDDLNRKVRDHTYLSELQRALWKDDPSKRIPLNALDETSLRMLNWSHNDFTKNILQQGWISYKQYSACIKAACRRQYAPAWESDNDNHLYYGMEQDR